MKSIIFATTNKSKLAQIGFIVEHLGLPIEILSGQTLFGPRASYEEVGETVERIALNGALTVASVIRLPVMTEDADFQVEELNGEPGIRAGAFLKHFGRVEILKRMNGVTNRKAIIRSAVAFATPEGMSKTFMNTIEGTITNEERYGPFPDWIAPTPTNPFGGGYNAIVIPNGWDKTLAEISPAEAIPWSYRERNFINILHYLLEL